MKPIATPSKPVARSSSRRYSYQKALDARKHPIRGLWKRNGQFVARITVEDDVGRKAVKWVPLDKAETVAQAQEEFRKLLGERSENRLRHIGRAPKFSDYVEQTYKPRLATSGKKADTHVTELVHLKQWQETIGHLSLDKIRPHHISGHLQKLKTKGRANRTCNLAVVVLRNVLKSARMDGFIKTLPVDGITWMKCDKKAARLYTREDIDKLCKAAFQTKANKKGVQVPVTKNAQQFSDFIRLLAASGAREQEAIRLRWADVDFERKLLTVGAEGDSKNREARRVDFNTALETHLREMFERRQHDSQWLFPSPQRGDKDNHARTFRESLNMVREAAGLPEFGFHDLRHSFCSYGVMSGIDFMTLARWAGHKDGGVLIGKTYGHLSNAHAQAQAARLNFGPAIVPLPAAVND